MNSKALIWLGVIAGSLLGGFVPTLWGADVFSILPIIFSALGALLGLWLGFKLSR